MKDLIYMNEDKDLEEIRQIAKNFQGTQEQNNIVQLLLFKIEELNSRLITTRNALITLMDIKRNESQ